LIFAKRASSETQPSSETLTKAQVKISFEVISRAARFRVCLLAESERDAIFVIPAAAKMLIMTSTAIINKLKFPVF